jgi:hypothetical protein
MPARVPLDVDLEDKLIYGLTPMRLAYAVVALLSGFALWTSSSGAAPIRAFACAVVIGIGSILAWGRWRGRAADSWLIDCALFVTQSHRVVWNERWLLCLRRLQRRALSLS